MDFVYFALFDFLHNIFNSAKNVWKRKKTNKEFKLIHTDTIKPHKKHSQIWDIKKNILNFFDSAFFSFFSSVNELVSILLSKILQKSNWNETHRSQTWSRHFKFKDISKQWIFKKIFKLKNKFKAINS